MNHKEITRHIAHSDPEKLRMMVAMSDALMPLFAERGAAHACPENAFAFLLGTAVENLRALGLEEDEILNLVEVCFDSLRNTTAEQRAAIDPMVRALARPPGSPHFRGEGP